MFQRLVWAGALIFGILANSQVGYGYAKVTTTVTAEANEGSAQATAGERIHSVANQQRINKANQNRPNASDADLKPTLEYDKVLACILAAGIGTKGKEGSVTLKKAETDKKKNPSFILNKDGIERIAAGASNEDSEKLKWTRTMERFLVNVIREHFRFKKSDVLAKTEKKDGPSAQPIAHRIPTAKEQANLKRIQGKIKEMENNTASASEFESRKAQAMRDFYQALYKYESGKYNQAPASLHPVAQVNRFEQLSRGYEACETFLEPAHKAGKVAPVKAKGPAAEKDQIAQNPRPGRNRRAH